MSWASHDLEPYVIQRHFGDRIAIVPLLVGSYAPDLATKWMVYGTSIFGFRVGVDDPAQFHRGFPGAGFTHSPFFGVVGALLIYLAMGNRKWAWSFLIGQWAHAFTDVADTLGTMLLFPFSAHIFSIGLWPYAATAGRLGDAGAYFSGPAFVWDGVWIVLVLLSWQVFTRTYFHTVVAPGDPFWERAGQRLPERAVLALYRASAFYGATRWLAWLIWAHVITGFAFDLSWGGPHWIDAVHSEELNTGCAYCSVTPTRAALGMVMLAGVSVLFWRRLTRMARAPVPAPETGG